MKGSSVIILAGIGVVVLTFDANAGEPFENFYVGADIGASSSGSTVSGDYNYENLFAAAADSSEVGTAKPCPLLGACTSVTDSH